MYMNIYICVCVCVCVCLECGVVEAEEGGAAAVGANAQLLPLCWEIYWVIQLKPTLSQLPSLRKGCQCMWFQPLVTRARVPLGCKL